MTTKINKTEEDDEIDLGKLLFGLYVLLKRRSRFLLICTLIGFTIGVGYYFISPPVYYSNMTISTGMLTTFNSKSLFNTLESLILEKNYRVLSEKLNLTIDQVKKIKSISVVSLAKDEENPDKANLFQIDVNVKDQSMLDSLEFGIIYYLEENPYVKKRINLKRKNIQALLGKINQELVGLDTLKVKLSADINFSRDNNVVLLDPVSAFRETVALFQRELELQSEFELIDNIQVIENFTYFNKKVSPRFRSILFGILGGFFFGFITILLMALITYIKKIDSMGFQE